MPGLREFLRTRNGQYVAIAAAILGVAVVAYSIYANLGSAVVDMANSRIFIDPKSGQPFTVKMGPGVELPPKAPSGAEGVTAEACYWTKDGKSKPDPTYVALNSSLGKSEPTFCPDCGRLVRGHNPPALTGGKPPPTAAEYQQRRSSSPERR